MNRIRHLVRYSVLGNVGRFASSDARRYPRGCHVVCRTQRGLEIGEVLGHTEVSGGLPSDSGTVLRAVTAEDDLLLQRLDRYRHRAMRACEKMLGDRGLSAVLVDVEHLFDGESLFFYFLGEVSQEVNELTGELAQTYDAEVQFKRFAQTLAEGCGPDCGTEAGGGCGDSCTSCSVASACGARGAD